MATSNNGDSVIIELKQSKIVSPSINAIAWSPDGRKIATADDSNSRVTVWDSESLMVIRELDQGSKGLGHNHVAFSADGRYLASGLGIVNVWDTATWKPLTKLVAPHITPDIPQYVGVRSLAFTLDGRSLVVVYDGSKQIVIAFQVPEGKIAWSHEPKPTIGSPLLTTPIVFSPDGQLIVLGTGERGWSAGGDPLRLSKILILDANSGALRNSVDRVHTDSPTALAISRDGKWIATGTSTGTTDQTRNIKTGRTTVFENKDPIRIWELASGKLVKEVPISSRVWTLAFSANGKYLVSSRSDINEHMTLAVSRLDSGAMLQQLKVWPVPLGLAVNPDGKRIGVAASNQLLIFEFLSDK